MEDEHAYALLATLVGSIRTQLSILICFRGSAHYQIVHIQINPHARNVLGRIYHHQFAAHGTQDLAPHIKMPKYNIEKGLTGRKADTLMWAANLLHNIDTLEVYEEAIRQSKEDPPAST